MEWIGVSLVWFVIPAWVEWVNFLLGWSITPRVWGNGSPGVGMAKFLTRIVNYC